MSLNFDLISSEFNFNVASDSDRVVYVFDEYRLDKSLRMLYRGTRELALPPKAVETLIALIEMRGQIVGKYDLMKSIWADTIVEESNLAHHLHVLRKTLGEKSDGQTFIETFRGRGYRFNSDVSVIIEPHEPKPNGNGTNFSEFDFFPTAEPEAASDLLTYPADSILLPTQPLDRHRSWALIAALGAVGVLLIAAAFFYLQSQPVPVDRRGEISVTALTNGNAVLDATISPDGRYFVYHETEQDKVTLWLQQTGQTGRIEIIPSGDRVIGAKTFSPNGEFVYFVGQEKGDIGFSLYRVPTFGGPLTKILPDVASPVSFSPDANEIAFSRYDNKSRESHLVIADADGRSERILLTRAGDEKLSIGNAWSPDGRFISFGAIDSSAANAEGTCSIAAVEVRTGTVKALSPERWDTCYRMAWTPEGDGVVFIGTRAGESYTARRDQVYYLSVVRGESRRVSTDGSRYQASSLGITADKSLLVVPSKRLSQIWVVDSDGDARTAVQLTNGQAEGLAGIAPLPDGRIGYLSRVGNNLGIWVMNADGSNQHQISDQLPFVEELRASPDGRFFIFSARRDGFSHLYRIDPDGQNLKRLTDGESYEIDSTISPDSHWVYYGSNFVESGISKTRLQRTDIVSGETVVLKEMESPALVPNISPDGKLIAGGNDGRVTILSAIDGSSMNSFETDKAADLQAGAKWTPDGTALTYLVYRENRANVWIQPLDGSAPRALTDFPKGYVYNHAFSNDGTKLYVARGYQVRDAVLIKDF